MRRPLVPILLVLLLAAFAAACGDDDTPDDPSSTADGSDEDDPAAELSADETEAEVAVGEQVVLELDENASVGDDWRLSEEPDEAVLSLVEESFELEGEDDCAGCGGTVSFVFEAVAEGEATFTMANCYRCTSEGVPSEEPPPPAEIEFRVEVTG